MDKLSPDYIVFNADLKEGKWVSFTLREAIQATEWQNGVEIAEENYIHLIGYLQIGNGLRVDMFVKILIWKNHLQ